MDKVVRRGQADGRACCAPVALNALRGGMHARARARRGGTVGEERGDVNELGGTERRDRASGGPGDDGGGARRRRWDGRGRRRLELDEDRALVNSWTGPSLGQIGRAHV